MNKGQYFTLEQMLLFTIGILITMTIYFSLVTVNESIKGLSEEDQMYEIGKLIYSQMNRAYHSPEKIVLGVGIPKKISGTGYRIYIEDDGMEYNLTVRLSDKTVSIPISKEYNASGMLFSSAGKAKIVKINNKIIIGRF
jgi:hypothetical protein